MAILSNVNGKFAVDSTGAVQFSGAAGASGYVLKSNGTGSAPTWVDGSTVIGGPYLPLSGGTLTGATATASGISFTVGGAITVQSGNKLILNRPNNAIDCELSTDSSGTLILNSRNSEGFKFQNAGTNFVTGDSSGNVTFAGTITSEGLATFNDGITLGGSNKTLKLLYNNTANYIGNLGWAYLQLGNNGSNDLVAGNTAAGGYLRFFVNNTNDIGGDAAPNGTLALTLASNGNATFAGNVHIVNGRLDLSDGTVYDSSINAGSTLYLNCDADNNSSGEKVIIGHGAYGTGSSAIAVFQEDGKVGIGTNSPSGKLHVIGATGLPATSGTTFTGTMRLQVAGYGTTLDFGAEGPSTGKQWIQATDSSNLAITYPLLLNPNGGNVGIGTTSPTSTLSVQGTTNNGINVIGVGTTANRCYVGLNSSNHGQLFVTGSSGQNPSLISSAGDNSYISGGNVGIGKTNPAYKLDVTGSIYCTAAYVRASTAPDIWYSNNNTDTYTQTVLYMAQNNTSNNDANGYFLERGRISNSSTAEIRRWVVGARGGQKQMVLDGPGTLTVSGDLVAYGSPSDKRLKENIKPIKNPLGKIKKLKGVTFNWKKSDSILDIKEDYGFIAQDVKKVIPELVRKNENELLSMRHQGIIPILVEAIKELEARVKELENK